MLSLLENMRVAFGFASPLEKEVELSRLSSPDKQRHDLQADLARQILEFRKTPAVLAVKDMPPTTLRLGKSTMDIAASSYNPAYFQAAAAVIGTAERLGYEPFQVQAYPEGYKRLKEGSIEGVESPLRLAADIVKVCAIDFYRDNEKLSDIYRATAFGEKHGSFGKFLGDAFTTAEIDEELTEIACASPLHAAPAKDPFITLHRPPSPGSVYVRSL